MIDAGVSFQELRELIGQTAGGSGHFADSNGALVAKRFNYNEPAASKSFEDLSLQEIFVSDELRQLLSISNGFEIYNYDGIDGYRIFSTIDLQVVNKSISDSYGDLWDDRILIFIECIGDGSYLGLKRTGDAEEVVDCFLEADPSEWKSVAPSISIFFAQLIKSSGHKFWLENSRSKNGVDKAL